MKMFDLDAYLDRIRFTGARTPTLDTLAEIHVRHPEAIPFENLNPFLGWPVRLDAAALQQKLVRDGRGGYCYEHNLLLGHALGALGFQPRGLAARVMWNVTADRVMPRTHMLLLVTIGGEPYAADVGFGGLTLTAPLRLAADVEQPTPHEPFRLIRSGDAFAMEARVGAAWMPLYCFGLEEHLQADYEVTSWYLSNHPESHFVTGLIAARTEPGRRYTLRNTELAIHPTGGGTQRRTLSSAAAVRAALEEIFRVAVPRGPEVDAALGRLVAKFAAFPWRGGRVQSPS